MAVLRSWVVMLRGVGHRSVLIMGLVRSRLSTFFFNVQQLIPETNFLDDLKTVLPPDALEAFLCGSIFDKNSFCLGKARYVSK